VTCQILPPNFAGYRRYCPYTAKAGASGAWGAPDLEHARRLVRSSGTAGQAVTVWIPKWTQFSPAAGRYIVSVLDSLGYKARYRFAVDPFSNQDKLRLQAGINGWYADFAAPAGFIGPTLTCAAYNPVNSENLNIAEFCGPGIDREIARARSLQTSDPEAASRLWAKIDRDLTDQAPWLAFANGIVLDVKSARVGNYQHNPQWGALLGQLWVR
jgi:peptide/nickel transport system substrate-binding protein